MLHTIWPAPITPSDLTSAARTAEVELKFRATAGPLRRETKRIVEVSMAAVVSGAMGKSNKGSEGGKCEEANQYTAITSRAFGRHSRFSIVTIEAYISPPCILANHVLISRSFSLLNY